MFTPLELIRLGEFRNAVDWNRRLAHGFRVYPIGPLQRIIQAHRWRCRFDFDPEAVVPLYSAGVSHFRYLRDNTLLTCMHPRLFLGFLLRLPWLIWRVGRTDYHAPLVVVQIVTGILLGPGVLGRFSPDAYAFVFNPPVVQSLNGIAWWAVMLFVMIAGVEFDLRQAWVWAHRRESSITAGLPRHAARLRLPGRRPDAAARRLDRVAGDGLAVRRRHRHGVRGDGAADPDPADGKARHPAPANRPAHPVLRQSRRYRSGASWR